VKKIKKIPVSFRVIAERLTGANSILREEHPIAQNSDFRKEYCFFLWRYLSVRVSADWPPARVVIAGTSPDTPGHDAPLEELNCMGG
jgi:hypothetical protein